MATATTPKPATTGEGILALAFEAIAVGLIALIAGINDDMGKAMVMVMAAFWIIYMITNSVVISTFGKFVATITGNA
jgi:hypothetical protein